MFVDSKTLSEYQCFFYQEKLDFSSINPTSKIEYIWRVTLSLIYLPIHLVKNIHGWIGRIILRTAIAKYSKKVDLETMKTELASEKIWKKLTQYKIQIDEAEINAFALEHNEPTGGRWLLVSNGLGGRAINRLQDSTDLAQTFHANMLVFDYPGTGESTGLPKRSTLVKTYQTALNILQNKLQAQQLILYGHSFGGGVQAEALQGYTFPKNFPVVAIKSRTFSSMTSATRWMVQLSSAEYLGNSKLYRAPKAISSLLGRITQVFILFIGWNIKTAEASRNLDIPEIILYSASPEKNTPIHDGVIPASGTLPQGLGKPKKKSEKILIPVLEAHNDPLSPETLQCLGDKVNSLLSIPADSSKPLSPN